MDSELLMGCGLGPLLRPSGVCSRPHRARSNGREAVAGRASSNLSTEEQLIDEGSPATGWLRKNKIVSIQPPVVPVMTSKLAGLEVMEKKGETKEEGDATDMREGVKMELSILDCPVCYEPLRAPILQCGVGHVLCSTCYLLLDKCSQCSGTVFQRCFIMESVVESVVAPCSFSKHGCVEEITRFNKKKHEEVCSHRPCFCPDSGCSFAGTTAPLLVHFTTHHEWPSKEIKYYEPFILPVKPGPCMLHVKDGHLFLMNMEPLEPLGHAISLVCVQPTTGNLDSGHNQTTTLEAVKSSSLLEGPPNDYFCIVPYASDRGSSVMLRIIIDTELVYDEVNDELEDEDEDDDDDDESYDEDEDDDAGNSDDD
ncbi:hypothetical protein EJB05_05430, partial [Eragrostis curvula]